MLLPVAFLPFAAVLIQDVKTETKGTEVTIEVATSQPLGRGDVRVVPAGSHRLYLYLDKTAAGKGSFGAGDQTVLVHRRARYTKLEIPAPGHCADPVSVERTPTGIRVRPTCEAQAPSSAAAATREQRKSKHHKPVALPVHRRADDERSRPAPEEPRAGLERQRERGDSLRAALALPPEAVAAQNAAEGGGNGIPAAADPTSRSTEKPNPAAVAEEKEPESKAAAQEARAPAGPAKPAQVPEPDVPPAAAAHVESPSASSVGDSRQPSKAFTPSTLVAVVLLVGLGIAAVVFTRRHVKRDRIIRIVETASIGPRRSLVVASIGTRTMVLGVSEAGVALLDAPEARAPGVLAPGPVATSIPGDAALALRERLARGPAGDEPKPEADRHEGSLLGRLFHGGKPTAAAARRAREFDELLEESLEDQELRRKLALGEGSRVA